MYCVYVKKKELQKVNQLVIAFEQPHIKTGSIGKTKSYSKVRSEKGYLTMREIGHD